MNASTRPLNAAVVEALLTGLAEIVGPEWVTADPAVTASFGHDLTGRFFGLPLLVVSPRNTAEVSAVVRACATAAIPIVPQGGHSGMVGGATPRNGEVVLSLRRLDEIETIDPELGQVTIGAGVILERLQHHAKSWGLEFPVDHGARSAATLGGMAATNAGGPYALRYGVMRSQVCGLEAVLADGRVITRLQGLAKDNAGYDLTQLLIGSEGTLAVITRLRVKLIPLLKSRVTALVGVPSLEQAIEILGVVRHSAPSVRGIDFFELAGLRKVCDHLDLPPPFPRDSPFYLVLDLARATDPTDELEALASVVDDAVVASDTEGRTRLWLYREAHNETINSLGVPHKFDVSVPIRSLPTFARDVRTAALRVDPRAEVILYGHLGDGNVHVNVLGLPVESSALASAVLQVAADVGGSISAEHGIGLAKTEWLSLTRSQAEIEAMRAIKQALDPLGILNPGRVLGLD